MAQYKKFFTMSYDDGVIWDKPFIEILNAYGLKCTFNLNSGLLGQKVDLTQKGVTFNHDKVRPEDVHDLYLGHEVATHSRTHPWLLRLSREEIIDQIIPDREALSALVGYDVNGHAYPSGPEDQHVADALRDDCGIRYARNVADTHAFPMPTDLYHWAPTCHHTEDDLFELADKFIAAEPTDGDMLFYVWGHTYEFNINDDWDRLRRFCERMAGHADITYATNGQIVDHILGIRG